MVELSNALGVDGVVTGSLGSFGGRYTVNVKVVGAKDGEQLGVFSATAESERGLPDVLSRAAKDIAGQVKVAMGLEEAPEQPRVIVVRQTFSNRQRWALVPGGFAVIAFVLGGVEFGLAAGNITQIDRLSGRPELMTTELPLAVSLRNGGDQMRIWGWVGIGVGAAAVAGAAWLFFGGMGGDEAVKPSVALWPGGGAVTVGGALPW